MKKYIYCVAGALISVFASAQTNSEKFDYKVTLGLNFGGLSPIPLPDNIREIKSYDPGFNPSLGFEVLYQLEPRWSLGISPRAEYKGMAVKDRVIYFHTLIQMGEGSEAASFEGDFSGINYTEAKNLYFGIPIFIQLTPGEKWHYRLGGYIAFLLDSKFKGTVSDGYIRNGGSLGERVEVSSASFDFGDKLRKTDYGIYAGVSRDVNEKFSVDFNLLWGLRSAFPGSFTGISFPMFNIYGQIGTSYQF